MKKLLALSALIAICICCLSYYCLKRAQQPIYLPIFPGDYYKYGRLIKEGTENSMFINPKEITILGEDENRSWRGTNNIMIGYKTGWRTTNSNVILLGAYANTTNDYELVIRFRDGSEFRHKLPTNTTTDMRGMYFYADEKVPPDPSKEKP